MGLFGAGFGFLVPGIVTAQTLVLYKNDHKVLCQYECLYARAWPRIRAGKFLLLCTS